MPLKTAKNTRKKVASKKKVAKSAKVAKRIAFDDLNPGNIAQHFRDHADRTRPILEKLRADDLRNLDDVMAHSRERTRKGGNPLKTAKKNCSNMVVKTIHVSRRGRSSTPTPVHQLDKEQVEDFQRDQITGVKPEMDKLHPGLRPPPWDKPGK